MRARSQKGFHKFTAGGKARGKYPQAFGDEI
jgi:hypothetical protein